MSVTDLPTLNASLNGVAALFLISGYSFVRRRRLRAHRNCMLAAFGCSVLFLVSYLYYHSQVGSVPFEGTGAIRTLYFAILLTHTVLAAIVPFLAMVVLYRGLRGDFLRHVPLARRTLPIWLYVSITGVVVYMMLYRLDFG